jgi:hypothetical protein
MLFFCTGDKSMPKIRENTVGLQIAIKVSIVPWKFKTMD